jgi:hypothetical protein
MPRPLQNGLRALALLVLACVAHGPLLGAGWRAPDLRLFERTAEVDHLAIDDLAESDPTGAPLANLERLAWVRGGGWRAVQRGALGQRAEALLLLLAAAAGLGLFARRLLLPWTGAEHAGAAGLAAAALCAAHPAATPLIADAGGADELRALCLSAWSAWLFLVARQERRPSLLPLAWLLALAAALLGELGWALPAVLALAELVSARRHRPRRERWRTALNTLFFFGLAAAVAPVLWIRQGGASRFGDGMAFAAEAPAAGARALLERAGLLLLPLNPWVTGAGGALAAGAVLLFALQPALVAARSAPRLWSRMLVAWLVLLACGLFYALDVRVDPRSPTQAALLAGGLPAAALGLAVAGTALVGWRRAAFPWVAGALYAGLAYAGAGAWSAAAGVAQDLRRDLAEARARFGDDARFLVLDAPLSAGGVETLGQAVGALVEPALSGGARRAETGVIALSAEAFKALAYEREFPALRAERRVVLAPLDALPAAKGAALRAGGGRLAQRLEPPPPAPATNDDPAIPTSKTLSWRGLGGSRSPDLDVDTQSIGMLVVRVDARTDVSVQRRAAWRSSASEVEGGSQPMVWIETGDEPVLVADLGDSLEWRLGGRVQSVWIEGGVTTVTNAELLPAPPPFSVEVRPEADGDDWLFPRATTPLVEDARDRGRYVLTLLSLKTYELRSLPVERSGEERLRAAGAARAVAELPRPVAWSLSFEVEGVPLARASGRRVGRDGTVEDR